MAESVPIAMSLSVSSGHTPRLFYHGEDRELDDKAFPEICIRPVDDFASTMLNFGDKGAVEVRPDVAFVIRKFVAEARELCRRPKGLIALRYRLKPFSQYGRVSVRDIERRTDGVRVVYRYNQQEFQQTFPEWPISMEFMRNMMGYQSGIVSVYNEQEILTAQGEQCRTTES